MKMNPSICCSKHHVFSGEPLNLLVLDKMREKKRICVTAARICATRTYFVWVFMLRLLDKWLFFSLLHCSSWIMDNTSNFAVGHIWNEKKNTDLKVFRSQFRLFLFFKIGYWLNMTWFTRFFSQFVGHKYRPKVMIFFKFISW